MYLACRRPYAATLISRRGVGRSFPVGKSWRTRCMARRKRNVSDCPMLRRRYLASLSLSRNKKGRIEIGSGKGDAAGSTLYLE